jgi:hypothetical protein
MSGLNNYPAAYGNFVSDPSAGGAGYYGGMGNFGAYAGLAGSLTSAFSQWNQANMINDSARFNNDASVFESRIFQNYSRMSMLDATAQRNQAEFNAMSSDIAAEGVKTKTAEALTKIRKEGSKVQGAQVARYGKAGVTMEGTPALVVKETSEDIEGDLSNILAAGRMEEMALRLQGKMTRGQGQLAGLKSESQALNFNLQGMNALHTAAWQNYAARFKSWTTRFGAMNTLLTGLNKWQMPGSGYRPDLSTPDYR